MKFILGQVVSTPGALEFCERHEIDLLELVMRHSEGDDGDLDAEDKQANRDSIRLGLRVFSSYNFRSGKIWVITEADRSSTTVLLPEEY